LRQETEETGELEDFLKHSEWKAMAAMAMGVPHSWMVYNGKSQNKADDN
jgi:hypothetical protein